MVEKIDGVINAISGVLYQPYIVPLFLLVAGVYFTVRTGLLQISLFGESIKVVSEKPKEKGSVSSFGALMVSTASRVGTGNIIGVSTAICLGGPGAIFWMWMSAFFGMATIYAEATLAQNYKTVKHGEVTGGPVYYIHAAFKGLFGKILGVIFAIFLILALGFMGNMVQSNSIGSAFVSVFESRGISAAEAENIMARAAIERLARTLGDETAQAAVLAELEEVL